MTDTVNFNDLPHELKLLIFSYLPEEEYDCVSCVNRAWDDLIKQTIAHRKQQIYRVLIEHSRTEPPMETKGYDCVIHNVDDMHELSVRKGCLVSLSLGNVVCNHYTAREFWELDDSMWYLLIGLIETLRPFELNVNIPLLGEKLMDLFQLKALKSCMKVLRINVAQVFPLTTNLTEVLPKLRSLVIYDTLPYREKQLELCEMPVTTLSLTQGQFDNSLPSHRCLYDFILYGNFQNLVTLILRRSTLTDTDVQAIYRRCPVLWTLDVEKAQRYEYEYKLTNNSLRYLLHMRRLKHIEVTFTYSQDWLYSRKEWTMNCCANVKKCRKPVEKLLENWEHVLPSVVDN